MPWNVIHNKLPGIVCFTPLGERHRFGTVLLFLVITLVYTCRKLPVLFYFMKSDVLKTARL